jgi:hypothetical protein
MNSKSFHLYLVAALFAILAGCEKTENPVDSGSVGTYVGTFFSQSDTSAGLVMITIQSSGSVSGSAFMWNDTLESVSISGTVANNTFTGTASDGSPIVGTLSGTTFAGNANNGDAVFTLNLVSGAVTLLKYYGTFTSTSGPSESGNLFICTAATTMWGVVLNPANPGEEDHLVGTITGTTISARDPESPGTEVATGTLSGSTWSGTYTGDQSSGTWSVTLVP